RGGPRPALEALDRARPRRRPAGPAEARAVVDGGRDLPAAQRADADAARARRTDRTGVEHREAVLDRDEPEARRERRLDLRRGRTADGPGCARPRPVAA